MYQKQIKINTLILFEALPISYFIFLKKGQTQKIYFGEVIIVTDNHYHPKT